MEDAPKLHKRKVAERKKGDEGGGPLQEALYQLQGQEAPPFQRVNAVYTPLTVPITQALMAVEGKCLQARPKSWKEGPNAPSSTKFCHFHNDYDHTTEECRHLKNEIERLIQDGYLVEYVCWEKARGMGPYQKREDDKAKEAKVSSPEPFSREGAKYASGRRPEIDNPPCNGVIRIIAGGLVGRDSHHARKSQIREAHDISLREVLVVETMEDTPLIQFGRAKQSRPKTSHNDALVIMALLANYEVHFYLHIFRKLHRHTLWRSIWVRGRGGPSSGYDPTSSDSRNWDYPKNLHAEIFGGRRAIRL
ncbi:UNVERIFIED_CONTAM: hypothetical protein Slati_0179000 [Sesamum latifolium]|uniref:Uncharacterized protein n=1 Tax=Sesamum latifolium TaxID=2727402 RepID=A0AAW2YB06_9LAMI